MNALNHLLISEQKTIAQGLKFYAEALVACHKEKVVNLSQNIEIVSGYRAGMIGRVTEMHGTYYSKKIIALGVFLKLNSQLQLLNFLNV
ncbi:hypothetical protein [Acinetobacter bereziniae]|uniref:hypothetical protein n=1 Tax=Acinetobacter bereziniae TaxID=106648 RepID=UPI001D0EA000|nr:hypothetical protein [Acinetobacter bereziniae]